MTDQTEHGASRAAALIIGAALFMQSFDAHAVAAIAPAIADALGASPIELNLVVTAYYVGAAVFLPVSGWCADRFGARRVFQFAIAAFIVGSIICGLARNVSELAFTRALLGASTAGLMPVGRLILIRTSERSELVRQLTFLTLPPMLGPIAGPVIAGALASYDMWRLVFLLGAPVGLLGFLLVWRYVPALREIEPKPLDLRGAVIAGLGLSTGVFVLERVGRSGDITALDVTLFSICAICIAAYALHARKTPFPILDFSLLRIPTLRAGVLGGFFFRLSAGAEPFLLALLFQVGLGFSPLTSGALVMFTGVGAMLMKPASPRVIRRFGFKRLLIGNTLIATALYLSPIFFTETAPLALIAGLLTLRGFFRTLQLSTLNIVTYVDVEQRDMSAASSFAATVQQVTHGLAIAAAAGAVAFASGAADIVRRTDIVSAFVVISAISVISMIFLVLLPKDAGAEVSRQTAN